VAMDPPAATIRIWRARSILFPVPNLTVWLIWTGKG
jgi:hypothetical protein